MPVVTLELGPLGACCHIVSPAEESRDAGGKNKPCVVIDPGAEPGRVTAEVKRLGLAVELVLLTHSHADHVGGVEGLLADWPEAVSACSAETSRRAMDPRLNLSVFLGEAVSCPPAGRILRDGETFEAGGILWRAVEVPGHDPGEMVYVAGDGGMAFTGDTVFAGSVGRSDFPGGDGRLLIDGVTRLLKSLPPDSSLFPGHGPSTKVRDELADNPFLRRDHF